MDENINLQQNDDNLLHSFFISLFNPEVWFKVLTHIQINYLSSKLKDVLKSIHVYILKGNSLNNMCHSVRVYQATILMSEIEAYQTKTTCQFAMLYFRQIAYMMYICHTKSKAKKNPKLSIIFFSDERLKNCLVKPRCYLFDEYNLLHYLKLEAITFSTVIELIFKVKLNFFICWVKNNII